ncbi:hypothetical protein CQW23_01740 [Capsicum baccatum]|uniref:Uncharacterized protein n=1 Tax=Capsicum baccatum TaxID=33114 RepID=A0A2G2XPG1_CAPBA|nr:hypothetical protein CQW23_01740 [Capsicum baccatum]
MKNGQKLAEMGLFIHFPDSKEISDYAESSEDVLPECSVSGDSEESEGIGRNNDDGDNDPLFVPSLSRFIFVKRYDLRTIMDEVRSFPAKISVRLRMIIYQEFKQVFVDQELKKRFKRSYFGHLRKLPEHLKFNGQFGCMRPFFILENLLENQWISSFPFRALKWHTTKSDQMIEGDPFKYKGKVTENVHPYIIPTIHQTKMDYMITFDPYIDKVKNNILDGLKQELEGVIVLILNEDSDDDGDLGGNPIKVRIGDDDTSSTSKDQWTPHPPRIFISVLLRLRKLCWILLPILERRD